LGCFNHFVGGDSSALDLGGGGGGTCASLFHRGWRLKTSESCKPCGTLNIRKYRPETVPEYENTQLVLSNQRVELSRVFLTDSRVLLVMAFVD